MRIGRTLPPAAAPIRLGDLVSGVRGLFAGRQELDRFQAELREHFGVRHSYLVSSGKAALTLILLALKERSPRRDEVVVPAFTCYSVPSSILRAGLRIRLCDLHPEHLDFDFAQLSGMLSGDAAGRILAVVPTHLFGFAADVAKVRQRVRDTGIAVLEDAAQAMGEATEAGMLGTLSDVGFFSLARGKALSVVEGGVILTNRDDLARVLDRLVDRLPRYGVLRLLNLIFKAAALTMLTRPRLFWLPRSLPFLKLGETLFEPHFPMLGMSSFQAGLARNWRRRLEAVQKSRRANAETWKSILEASGQSGQRGPSPSREPPPALLRFPMRISDAGKRALLLRQSEGKGLGIMPAYPTSINGIRQLRETFSSQRFPVAEGCARELVTLPTHEFLSSDDIRRIGGLVAQLSSPHSPGSLTNDAAVAGQR